MESKEEENTWKPDVILCGPGGSRGLLILGAIKRLFEQENFMENVKHWIGISVGAAISLLIVVGYTPHEIIDFCIDLNLIDDILHINLDEAREKLGLLKNKTIEEKLKNCISLKYGFVPTLSQLYMLTGITLTMVAFNMDKMRTDFLDKDTEGELSCVEAAMMSMAVPILMQPRRYKGCVYIDGAIGNSYPISRFDHDGNKIIGIYISSEEDLYCSDKKPITFIYRLIQASMKVIRDNEIKHASNNVKHIVLETLVRDTTGLLLDKEVRQSLITQGYETADNFLKINSDPDKYNLSLPESEEIPF
jgi:predicted acylesterase/phospholipase RssA